VWTAEDQLFKISQIFLVENSVEISGRNFSDFSGYISLFLGKIGIPPTVVIVLGLQ